MDSAPHLLVDLTIVAIFLLGIRLFRRLQTARRGNSLAALALACALAIVLLRGPLGALETLLPVLAIGALAGWAVAMRVHMIQIPAMVALQNGAGGTAAILVAFVELSRGAEPFASVREAAGILGLVVGALTAGGSFVAAGKLGGLIRQTPVVLPAHVWLLAGGAAASLAACILVQLVNGEAAAWLLAATILFSLALGIVFSIRVGGADMPVLISLLNSWSGLAAALCGIVVENRLLIVCGATVAASGLILTTTMCRVMNRRLWSIGFRIPRPPAPVDISDAGPLSAAVPTPNEGELLGEPPLRRAVAAAQAAKTIILIPGYGMALAHAQLETAELARRLRAMGKQVRFAVHPIAGRMPGHMHVLLAEVEVDSDVIFDLEEVNSDFHETDLAIIVGACDVVNPAAKRIEGTPITGMPILAAYDAQQVLVCNLDDGPGYSGVDNPLYRDPKAILMLGNAKTTLDSLLQALGR